jgi:hypothetical protein
MTRFAIIETNSGYVWGVVDAASPAEACRIVDEDFGAHGRSYSEGSVFDLRTTGGAYDVRIAPEGFDVLDGQDANAIASVDALPRAAIILTADDDR